MANWNAGAAFTNSFLSTLQGLNAAENAQMQNRRLQEQMQREKEYEDTVAEESKRAAGLDLGQVAQKGLKFTPEAQQEMQAFVNNPNLTQEEKLNAIKGYAGTEYATPTDKGGIDLAGLKAYQTAGGETKFNQLGKEALPSDVNRAVMQRMRESGNIYGQERALHMGKLAREDEAAQQEMDFSNWLTEQTKLIQTDPTKWVQENLTGYNKAGKGSFLNDGMTGKVVMSADGKTSSFVQMDKKGRTVASTPITAETAMQGLQAMAFDKYKAMPGKFKEAFTMGLEQEKFGETKRHNRAVEGIYTSRLGGGGAGGKTRYTQLTGGYAWDSKTNTYVDSNNQQVKDPAIIAELKKFGTKPPEMKALGEGYFQLGNDTFMADPKNPGKLIKVEVPGGGPNKYEAAVTQPGASGAEQVRPGGSGTAIPVNVPGRPLYNESTADLTRMAKRPKGVSTAEAAEAQAELDARKGESRMSALR